MGHKIKAEIGVKESDNFFSVLFCLDWYLVMASFSEVKIFSVGGFKALQVLTNISFLLIL